MRVPPAELRAIEAQTQKKAVRACPPQCTDYIEEPGFWPVPSLVAGVNGAGDYPASFTVYALQYDGNYDRPSMGGTAISSSTNEVVYWAVY